MNSNSVIMRETLRESFLGLLVFAQVYGPPQLASMVDSPLPFPPPL